MVVKSVRLYPATDVLYINCAKPLTSVQLYNSLGQLVNSQLNNNAINITGLPGGLYVLKAATGNNFYLQKVLVK